MSRSLLSVTVDFDALLGDLVAEDPRRSRVLEKYGLDYCCDGQRPLGDAARQAGLDAAEVAAALNLGERTAAGAVAYPRENAALAHDIVDVHHAYMWAEMPQLAQLIDTVYRVHGARHPELAELQAGFTKAVEALEPHMTTEERVVFPAISRFEKDPSAQTESFEEPIRELRAEHYEIGHLFKRLRSLTGDYAVPEDACASYRAMLARLQDMEHDLHEHIHKENNVLFPQVLALEKRAT